MQFCLISCGHQYAVVIMGKFDHEFLLAMVLALSPVFVL